MAPLSTSACYCKQKSDIAEAKEAKLLKSASETRIKISMMIAGFLTQSEAVANEQ